MDAFTGEFGVEVFIFTNFLTELIFLNGFRSYGNTFAPEIKRKMAKCVACHKSFHETENNCHL